MPSVINQLLKDMLFSVPLEILANEKINTMPILEFIINYFPIAINALESQQQWSENEAFRGFRIISFILLPLHLCSTTKCVAGIL